MGHSHRRLEFKEFIVGHLLPGLLLEKDHLRWALHLLRQVSNLASNRSKLNEPFHDNLCRQNETILRKVQKQPRGIQRLRYDQLDLNDNVLH